MALLTLACAAEYGLDDVYKFLFVVHRPINLVVISGTEIDHHVFISMAYSL